MDTQYVDPILKRYVDLIQGATGNFRRIYFGDPVRIGSSELPALVISKLDTRVKTEDNQRDRHELRISFTVVTDIRDTIGDERTMTAGVNALYNLIEGRNADYTLKPESLLGILRHYVELDTANSLRTDLNTASSINYGMTMGKRQPEAWSIEGVCEITATFFQNR